MVDNSHEGNGRVVVWQLFKIAPQDWVGGKDRDGDHEGWPAPTADRNYATGRSLMTTRNAVGAPPLTYRQLVSNPQPKAVKPPGVKGPRSRPGSLAQPLEDRPWRATTSLD